MSPKYHQFITMIIHYIPIISPLLHHIPINRWFLNSITIYPNNRSKRLWSATSEHSSGATLNQMMPADPPCSMPKFPASGSTGANPTEDSMPGPTFGLFCDPIAPRKHDANSIYHYYHWYIIDIGYCNKGKHMCICIIVNMNVHTNHLK